MNHFVLASASPRRRELLKNAGYDFEVFASNADESLDGTVSAKNAVEILCERKALDVLSKRPDCVVLGCDTVVAVDGKILGKPKNADDARQMLKMLSGKKHCVYSGVCAIKKGKKVTFSEKTEVEFFELSESTVDSYISTKEPMDKAGSYGIQGFGGLLVKGIYGDYYNVVGLPLAKTARVLSDFGIKGKIEL